MTLRARLLLSALVLSLATTFVLSLVLRSAWKTAEASRFEEEFQSAVGELENELSSQGARIHAQLAPLCDHDPLIDSALVGLQSGTLGSRLLSLRARLPELRKSLGLSELALVGPGGQVIAGVSERPETGKALSKKVRELSETPNLRKSAPRAFEAACVRESGGTWIALLGATQLLPQLERASRAHGLELSLVEGPKTESRREILVAQVQLPFLDGETLVATRSRQPLFAQLRHLDVEVATAALLTLSGAFLIAVLLSRGLARPVMAFAERTREAVKGRVQELPETGGPELSQAARAFNATLQDLRNLRERLAVTEKIAARREVARQIAHEIKNPLSPIRTSLETLRKLHHRGDPRFETFFEETSQTMLSEVSRLTTMVAHFSEYARLPSPRPRAVALRDLVEEIVQLHEGVGVPIETDLADLPPVLADRDQVAQVLTNLLKNALEAVHRSAAPRVLVRLHASDSAQEQCIEVIDNGPGIASERLERLFEPYATTKKEGTGLGLPISHRIAVEHGGDLTYRTGELGGARFALSLPTAGPPELAETPST